MANQHQENFAIKSTAFRLWLTHQYGERYPMKIAGRVCPSAPLLCDRYTLAARAIRWALPWSRDTFPGLRAGVREILRRPTITWATVQGWRAGRSSLPAEDAEMLAAYIRARAEPGIDLAKELENYAAKRRAEGRRARGFQVVRERDGPGSQPRDARWHGGRRKQIAPRKNSV